MKKLLVSCACTAALLAFPLFVASAFAEGEDTPTTEGPEQETPEVVGEIACEDPTANYEIPATGVYVINVESGQTVEFTGVLSGEGSVKKTGNGLLKIWSENSYKGGTYVDGGTAEAFTTTAFGSGTITIKGIAGSYVNGTYCGVRFSAEGEFTNDITIETGYTVPSSLKQLASTPTYYKSPQIDFGVAGESKTITLSGAITGPANGMTWIVDQGIPAVGGKKFEAVLSGTVNVPYCYCSPIGGMKFTGKTTATWMHFNRTNGTSGYKNTGSVAFGGTENQIGRISFGYNYIRCLNENALPGTILSADYSTSEATWTYFGLCGYDQTIAGVAAAGVSKSSVNPNAGYSVISADASGSWNSNSKTATLFIEPEDSTIEWSPARFYGKLNLVYNAKDGAIAQEFYNRRHEMSGSITVSNGTFRLTADASMPNVSAISAIGENSLFDCQTTTNIAYFAKVATLTALEGGEIRFPSDNTTDPFGGEAVNLVIDAASKLTLPSGYQLSVTELWYNGTRQNGGVYTTKDIPGLTGSILVAPYLDGDVKTVVWTGGAGPDDTSAETGANWEGGVAPDLTRFDCIVDIKGGTGMSLPLGAALHGIVFDIDDAVESFTISSPGQLFLGPDGLKTTHETADETVRNYAIDAPLMFVGAQLWNVNGLGTTLDVRQTLDSQEPTQFDRFGSGVVNFRAENKFTGTFYLTNGVTHVYSPANGLGAAGAMVEFGSMTNGNCQIVFHGVNESRDFSACNLVSSSQQKPLMVFAEGTENVLAGDFLRSAAPWSAFIKGSVYIKSESGAVARFTGNIDISPVVNFDGPGEFWSSGTVKSAAHIYLQLDCKYHLGNTRSYPYSWVVGQDNSDHCELFMEHDFAINASCKMAGGVDISSNSQVHLQGYDQRLNFVSNLEGTIDTPDDQPATVWIDYSRTDPRPQNMHRTTYSGTFEGPISLVLVGTNFTANVSGELGAKGSLTVCTNTFTIGSSTTWTNCTGVTVKDRGELSLTGTRQCFNRRLGWTVEGNGVLRFAANAVQRAGSLTVDGFAMPSGIYSSETCPDGLPDGITAEEVKAHFAAGGGALKVVDPNSGLIIQVY